ncbi:MAG TPA: hypothetical protein PLV42_03990 [bacterium]|nr:hypothetical protein [bacterium]
MNVRIFMVCAALLLTAGLFAEEAAPAAPAPTPAAEPTPAPAPATEPTPAAEPVPATEPAPAPAPTPAAEQTPEPKPEEKPAPAVEEKKIDTAAKEAPEPKKEPAAEEKKEIVRPYFGVAIASGVFGLLALASGFYFDHLADESFNSYKKMASRDAIEAAAKKPGFIPEEYLLKTRSKYDQGRQHLDSRNYSFIGGAIFVAAGVGLFFWTEEKKPEEEKKEETVSDKKVSVHSVGDRVTLNFSGSF